MQRNDDKIFYKQDKKEYELSNNSDFIRWFRSLIQANHYESIVNIDDIKSLIDFIYSWYFIKYPEREFDFNEGIRNLYFKDVNSIGNDLSFKQLLFRLPFRQLCLMTGFYRPIRAFSDKTYIKRKKAGLNIDVFIKVSKINNGNLSNRSYSFIINAKEDGTVVKSEDLEELIKFDSDVNLDDLFSIFSSRYVDELDFSDLVHVVYNHSCDIEVRNRVIYLAALKLLFSRNTNPQRGYIRAKKLISEANEALNTNISMDIIDTYMSRYISSNTDDIHFLVKRMSQEKR